MKYRGLIFFLAFSLLFALNAQAQVKKTRILFVLDASSSMTLDWNADYNKFSIARNILLQVVDSVYALNNEVEFAVRVYGADYPSQQKNCSDSKLIVPFNLQNTNQIKQSLLYVTPIGSSPIAYSLSEAAFNEINQADQYDYSIIFITDGGESCDGDICKTYLELLQKKVSVTPYIIGLDNNTILKSYYDCLGKYVGVLKTEDIPKAVKMIVDENRPIITKPKQLNLKTVYSNTKIKQRKDTTRKIVKVIKQKPVKKIDTVIKPIKKIDTVKKVVVKKVLEKRVGTMNRIPIAQSKQLRSFRSIPLYRGNNVALVAAQFRIDFEEVKKVVKPKFIGMERIIALGPRHRFTYALEVPKARYVSYVPARFTINYTPIKREIKIVRPNKPKPNNTTSNKIEVSRELIPSDETMVQVFFINKYQKKKVYRNATPTILVEKPGTKQQVSKFIRKVTNGQPELEPIKEGVYDFTVMGKRNLSTQVRIEKNQINKIYFMVSDGNISFQYLNNIKRPVKEYQADVRLRFDRRGKNVVQSCDEKLPYLPGTYYVEINTTPPTRWITVDVYFNAETVLNIAEPGFLQITNDNRVGQVDLKVARNNKFMVFESLKITGDFNSQKIDIQPGTYKAEFLINPQVPQLGTKEVTFKVRGNKTTFLKLE